MQNFVTRTRFGRTAAAFVTFGLLLTACGTDSVDHEALVTALTSSDQMSNDEAVCVADTIFAEGAFSEDDLKSAAADIKSVDGFESAIETATADCVGQ